MMEDDAGSTEEAEMSSFHALFAANGTKPFRFAPTPVDRAEQEAVVVPVPPDPPFPPEPVFVRVPPSEPLFATPPHPASVTKHTMSATAFMNIGNKFDRSDG